MHTTYIFSVFVLQYSPYRTHMHCCFSSVQMSSPIQFLWLIVTVSYVAFKNNYFPGYSWIFLSSEANEAEKQKRKKKRTDRGVRFRLLPYLLFPSARVPGFCSALPTSSGLPRCSPNSRVSTRHRGSLEPSSSDDLSTSAAPPLLGCPAVCCWRR